MSVWGRAHPKIVGASSGRIPRIFREDSQISSSNDERCSNAAGGSTQLWNGTFDSPNATTEI